MFWKLFAPAEWVSRRLSLSRKFLVLALCLGLPMAYATWQYRNAKEFNVRIAVKERHGVTYMAPADRLFELEVQARSAAVRGGPVPDFDDGRPRRRLGREGLRRRVRQRADLGDGAGEARGGEVRPGHAGARLRGVERGDGGALQRHPAGERGFDARPRPAARHLQHDGLDHEPGPDRDGRLRAGARPRVVDRSREGRRPRERADPARDPAGQHLVGGVDDRCRVRRRVRRHRLVGLQGRRRRVASAPRPIGRVGDPRCWDEPSGATSRARTTHNSGPRCGRRRPGSASPACPRSTSSSNSASTSSAARSTPSTRSSRSVS